MTKSYIKIQLFLFSIIVGSLADAAALDRFAMTVARSAQDRPGLAAVGAGLALLGTARNAFLVQHHVSELDTRVAGHDTRIKFLEAQMLDGVSANAEKKIDAGGPIIRRITELEQDVRKLNGQTKCKCAQSGHTPDAACKYKHEDFIALQQRVATLEVPASETKRAQQASEAVSATLLSSLAGRVDDLEADGGILGFPGMHSSAATRTGPRHVTPHAKMFFPVTQQKMDTAIRTATSAVYVELDNLIADIDSALTQKTEWKEFRTTLLQKIKARQQPAKDADREADSDAAETDSDREDEKERDRDRDIEKPARSLANGKTKAVTIQTDPQATPEG